ncbi:MAG: hypothetical protein ABI629_14300 [bacterium]
MTHRDHREWGEGKVVEEMTLTTPGGTCLVRIQFQDGRLRTFNNDLDAEVCAYHFGLRKDWDAPRASSVRRVRATRTPRRALTAPRARSRRG